MVATQANNPTSGMCYSNLLTQQTYWPVGTLVIPKYNVAGNNMTAAIAGESMMTKGITQTPWTQGTHLISHEQCTHNQNNTSIVG